MRTVFLIAALTVMAAQPVLAAAEAQPQKPKPLAAPLLNQPFGGVYISRGFTDRHYELPRKAKKQQPAPAPSNDQGKVMRGA